MFDCAPSYDRSKIAFTSIDTLEFRGAEVKWHSRTGCLVCVAGRFAAAGSMKLHVNSLHAIGMNAGRPAAMLPGPRRGVAFRCAAAAFR